MDTHFKNALSALIFVFFLCLATSALAGGPPAYVAATAAVPYFDGFYAGLGGGIVSSKAEVKDHYRNPGDPIPNLDRDMDLGKHGINGNAFIGFGKTLKSAYYLGLEGFANIFSPQMEGFLSVSAFSIRFNTKVKNPYSFGGDIRVGYVVLPRAMLYALFGLDYAKFKVESNISATIGSINNNFNKWKLGYMPGVGIEVGLADHLSLRAEYDYIFYSSFNNSSSKRVGTNTIVLQTRVKPRRGLFTLKLSYLFN